MAKSGSCVSSKCHPVLSASTRWTVTSSVGSARSETCTAVKKQISSHYLDPRHTKTFRLENQKRALRVYSGLATRDGHQQSALRDLAGSFDAKSSEAVHAIESLLESGQLDKMIDILLLMDQNPSPGLCRSLVIACTKRKSLAQAKRLYEHLARHGLDHGSYLGEYVVNMLVKCGSLEDAFKVFHRLKHRTPISWTAMIFGYTEVGQGQEAIRMYQAMREAGVLPNTYTFASLLKACASIADLDEGRRIHNEIIRYRCESNLIVGTCLVDMYAKFGCIEDAQHVFDRLSEPDVVAWNALLAGYAGQGRKVLQLYQQMEEKGVSLDGRTFVRVLQACGMLAENENTAAVGGHPPTLDSLQEGKKVHAEARMRGFGSDVFVGNALVSMYRKCGCMVDAYLVFDSLSERDVVGWNAMLAGYAQLGHGEKALQLFRQMQEDGAIPDDRTFVSVLQACGSLVEKEDFLLVDGQLLRMELLQQGKVIHCDVFRRDYESDVFIGSSLISLYAKCGAIIDAQHVFDRLSKQDMVAWTALLAGYADQGHGEKAMQLFYEMQEAGVSPDASTFVSVLQACSSLAEKEVISVLDGQPLRTESLKLSRALHAQVQQRGFASQVFVGSALITMYAKCCSVVDARSVFNTLVLPDVVSWTALLAAHGQLSQGEEVLKLYSHMIVQGVSPDDTAYMCILRSCGDTGALDILTKIHRCLESMEREISPLLASTLIHAYGKCARMTDAQTVFNAVTEPNVVSWTALLAGYAREGSYEQSLLCYGRMCLSGVKPNEVTFLCLLSACSHCGMVEEGVEYFECMGKDHGIIPSVEHYACLVDVLGRAGYFTMIESVLSKMPMQPDTSVWMCLLSSCRKHGNMFLGEIAFQGVVTLKPENAAAYVMMSNIYAQCGLWERANHVNQLRQNLGAWKDIGHTWIRHAQKVYNFQVGNLNPYFHELYAFLGKVSFSLEEVRFQTSLCSGIK